MHSLTLNAPAGGLAHPAPFRQSFAQPSGLGHYGHHLPLNGPIMTNLTNPNGHMSIMSGSMGVPPHGASYGHHHMANAYAFSPHHHGPQQQQPAPPERPFKCDVCPQSFNRNHDLKRHKRIHLAVKPFPCDNCEKSFSRKDALKVS
jgi:uncharacterized Zn-finger protein